MSLSVREPSDVLTRAANEVDRGGECGGSVGAKREPDRSVSMGQEPVIIQPASNHGLEYALPSCGCLCGKYDDRDAVGCTPLCATSVIASAILLSNQAPFFFASVCDPTCQSRNDLFGLDVRCFEVL